MTRRLLAIAAIAAACFLAPAAATADPLPCRQLMQVVCQQDLPAFRGPETTDALMGYVASLSPAQRQELCVRLQQASEYSQAVWQDADQQFRSLAAVGHPAARQAAAQAASAMNIAQVSAATAGIVVGTTQRLAQAGSVQRGTSAAPAGSFAARVRAMSPQQRAALHQELWDRSQRLSLASLEALVDESNMRNWGVGPGGDGGAAAAELEQVSQALDTLVAIRQQLDGWVPPQQSGASMDAAGRMADLGAAQARLDGERAAAEAENARRERERSAQAFSDPYHGN